MANLVELDIYLRLADASLHLAAELTFGEADAQGAAAHSFRYARSWLEAKHVFALDPRNLPMEAGATPIHARGLRPELGCLEDALPDAWGRQLFRRFRRPSGTPETAHLMRLVGAGALGAIAFSERGQAPQVAPELEPAGLEQLLEAAERFDRNEELEEELHRRLLAAGGTPGGARPKVLVRDADGHWLAKFPAPHRDQGRDIVGLEKSCLDLAELAMLRVPERKLLAIGARRTLLVRRFDIPLACHALPTGYLHRHHSISAATLMRESTNSGSGGTSYLDLAQQMRKVLGRPDEDTSSFFRLMVFNSAIGNTDDHLKNFRLQRESGLWRLAPCFDLLPDTGRNREHATPFHFSADAMDRVTALEIAKKMGIRQAASIVDEVCSAAFRFSEICETNRVPANDIDSFAPSIKRRLLLLSGGAASADRTSR